MLSADHLQTVDAKISFPSGLNVAWEGNNLGNIQMKAVQVVGDVGATLDAASTFNVASVATLTDFTKVIATAQ